MRLYPDSHGSFREANACHTPSGPNGGQFCTGSEGKDAQSRGWKIVFRSELQKHDHGLFPGPSDRAIRQSVLTQDEARKARTASVYLVFNPLSTAHLNSPLKWVAPNGVTVFYDRGQRRNEDSPTSAATYHDFNVTSMEKVIPLTRNIGAGRRALRAWGEKFSTSKANARFQARRLVRDGD